MTDRSARANRPIIKWEDIKKELDSLPAVRDANQADAIHGPWHVIAYGANDRTFDPTDEAIAALPHPEAVAIVIARGSALPIDGRRPLATMSRYDQIPVTIPGGCTTRVGVRDCVLRAQAMCAGLNLASIVNGIHIVPEETP